jgi:hypothetical protein
VDVKSVLGLVLQDFEPRRYWDFFGRSAEFVKASPTSSEALQTQETEATEFVSDL